MKIAEVYKTPIELVKMVSNGYGTALMLEGRGGLGKSHTILTTLTKEMGLVEGRDFVYIKGFSTPLALYKLLYQYREIDIIVLDDVEGLLQNRRAKSILKSALDPSNRKVCYETTAQIRIPHSFYLSANLIVCSNSYPDDIDFKAVMDRCLYYKFEFKNEEVMEILKTIAQKSYRGVPKRKRKEIINMIERNSHCINLSIRTLFKLFEIYKYNKRQFKDLAIEVFNIDKKREVVWELNKTSMTVKQQLNEYQRLADIHDFAKSRATFYNIRKELEM